MIFTGRKIIYYILFFAFFGCGQGNDLTPEVNPGEHDLVFGDLAKTWDEGMPIGNGLIGGLVWQKIDNLRISLDRSDLWDLRSSRAYSDSTLTYQWLAQHRLNGTYDKAREKLNSYREGRYVPTKLPGGGLEFPLSCLGEPEHC